MICFSITYSYHAPLSLNEVQEIARAKRKECAALVRIPVNCEEWIKRVMDLGVEGIIIPHVNTVEEAKRAVAISCHRCKQVPGTRISISRNGNRYALSLVFCKNSPRYLEK